jgi:hypothetical protein
MDSQSPLRARSATELLAAAVGLYRDNFGTLLIIVALVQGPVVALGQVYAGMVGGGWPGHAGGLAGFVNLLYLGAIWIAGSLCSGATTLAASDLCQGRKPTVRDCYARARESWGRLIGATFVAGTVGALGVGAASAVIFAIRAAVNAHVGVAASGVKMTFGSAAELPLIIGGIIGSLVIGPLLLAVYPAVVLEGRDGLGALDRSVDLVRRYWWHAFAVLAPLHLLATLPTSVVHAMEVARGGMVQGHPPFHPAQHAVAALIMVLVAPLVTAACVVVYYDLRLREEGPAPPPPEPHPLPPPLAGEGVAEGTERGGAGALPSPDTTTKEEPLF